MSGHEPVKVFSIVNFNPVALFSLILLLVALILGAVGTGLDRWTYIETERVYESSDGTRSMDTVSKTQGLFRRCINYEVASTLEQGDPPVDRCLDMNVLDCSNGGPQQLLSALDVPGRNELENAVSMQGCSDMRVRLQVSSAFMILALLSTCVAMVLFIPLWYYIVYIIAAIASVASVVFYAIGLGIFADVDQDFAGFFSVEGVPYTGCLWYGFGIALAAFLITIIATVIGFVSIFYRQFSSWEKSRYE